MRPEAIPPKNIKTWLTYVFSAEINLLRYLNGLSIEESFGKLVHTDYFFDAMRIETDEWQTPPYWGYAKICIWHDLERKPAQEGYPFPHRERIQALVAYIMEMFEKTGIRPDFLYEKMRSSGIFKDYAEGMEPVSEKAKAYAMAAESLYESMPKSSFSCE